MPSNRKRATWRTRIALAVYWKASPKTSRLFRFAVKELKSAYLPSEGSRYCFPYIHVVIPSFKVLNSKLGIGRLYSSSFLPYLRFCVPRKYAVTRVDKNFESGDCSFFGTNTGKFVEWGVVELKIRSYFGCNMRRMLLKVLRRIAQEPMLFRHCGHFTTIFGTLVMIEPLPYHSTDGWEGLVLGYSD